MRLWRKAGPPEPAAAHPAAAGARYGSEKERLKGDVQELARQKSPEAITTLTNIMNDEKARQLHGRQLRMHF